MFRQHYREKFGLTAEEMDNEPAQEVAIYNEIWKLQQEHQRLEELRHGQHKKT